MNVRKHERQHIYVIACLKMRNICRRLPQGVYEQILIKWKGAKCASFKISIPPCSPILQSSESSDLSDGPITLHEFMEVKSALTASEAKIQQLLKVNCHLSEELQLMQSKVCL